MSSQDVKVGQVEVTLVKDVTRQMVDDIILAAFEGGITYWCESAAVFAQPTPEYDALTSEAVSRGGCVMLTDVDGEEHFLDLARFIYGFGRFCEAHGHTPSEVYEFHDAGVADLIIQYAIFDTIVYA